VVKNEVTRDVVESPARRLVVVEGVETGSVAAAAGFRVGDVVDRIDDVAVFTSIDLERAFLGRPAGTKVPVKVTRGAAPVALEVSLDPAAKVVVSPADVTWRRLGLKVIPVGVDAVVKANPQLHGGLMVTEVAVGGTAAAAGIQKGDVLVGLHQWETLRPDDVAFVLNHKDFASFLPLKYYLAREGKLKDGWINGTP
jgi:serine protease Do